MHPDAISLDFLTDAKFQIVQYELHAHCFFHVVDEGASSLLKSCE